MSKSRYKMRINVYDTNGKRYGYISLSEDVAAMFDKPYVSIKRMQDRLAFVPWDNKTEQGIVSVSNGKIQFGLQSDCDKAQDFCGQYYLVNKTDSGIVFVKLADRHPFDRELPERVHTPHDKCTEPVVVTQSAGLTDMLRDAIERKKEEVNKAAENVTAAENLLNEAKERLDRLAEELRAYKTVLSLETVKRGD